jgi:hypothetical protein
MRDNSNQMQKNNSGASRIGSTISSFRSSTPSSSLPKSIPTPPTSTPVITPSNPRPDELARVFNTVLVSSQSKGKRDFSGELAELADSAPFKAILSAVRQLSRIHGLTERQASEQVIQTFRKMDQIWGEYVFREGLEKIKSSK